MGYGLGEWVEQEKTTTLIVMSFFKVLIFVLSVGTWLLLYYSKIRKDKIFFIPFRMLSETNGNFNAKVLCKL